MRFGIAPRSNVGLLANNGHELVTGLFGAWLANCVAVPLNARHKEHELGYIINNSQIALLLTAAHDISPVDFRDSIASALPPLSAPAACYLPLPWAPLPRHIPLFSG